MSRVHPVSVPCVHFTFASAYASHFAYLTVLLTILASTFLSVMPDTRRGSKQDMQALDDARIREIIRDEFSKMSCQLQQQLTTLVKETISIEFKRLEAKIDDQQLQINLLRNALVLSETSRLNERRNECASNVILSGLPEIDFDDSCDVVSQTTEALHQVIPDPEVVVSACRIGRKNERHPRKIKIVLRSRDDRNLVLKNAPKLKDSVFHGSKLYLDADRPYADRKEAARLRLKAKHLRAANPLQNITIWRGKLYVDNTVTDFEKPINHILPSE